MAPKSVITWCLCFLEFCLAFPTTLHFQLDFGNVFVSYSFTSLVVALATTVSALVDEGTVG